MPRELTFKIKRKEYQAVPVKIERKKLYGWSEILATDENGDPARIVNTDQSGTYIIPRSGTGLGVLSPEGLWVDRFELITVNEDGSPAELIPSSYSVTVELKKKVGVEEYLDHSITAFYELKDAPEGFARAVGSDIYTFQYCYVKECEGIPAFVMTSEKGGVPTVYMLLGFANEFQYLGLEQPGIIDDTEDDDFDEDNVLDFSMF